MLKFLVWSLSVILLAVGAFNALAGDGEPPTQHTVAGWKTNIDKSSIDPREIRSGGVPKDRIPALTNPKFVVPEEARQWLKPKEPVIALELGDKAKAYPLQILIWHEMANDVIGRVPVVVTFCPLCHSAIVFDRRLEGRIYEFGVSGLLRHSDMIMYDRQTESWWQQTLGQAIVGDLTGKRLKQLPSQIISFKEFAAAYPQGQVLSRDTGYDRQYGKNPYRGYDDIHKTPFLYDGPEDKRLPPMERVVGVTLNNTSKAYPYSLMAKRHVVHDRIGQQEVVIFHAPGTVSALDRSNISASRDIGATGVFSPRLEGHRLTFEYKNEAFFDRETNSRWNLLGQCIEGKLKGQQLEPVMHGDFFAFAWFVFKPGTEVYK